MIFILRLVFITVCFMLPAIKGFCQFDTTKENEFDISPYFFYSSYESSQNTDNDSAKRKGFFEGIFVADTYRPYNQKDWWINVFHVDVHGDYGNVDYKFPSDGNSKISSVDNYILEPRVWVGKDFNLGDRVRLTPYAGFGYRWYYERLKNKFTEDLNDGGNDVQTQYFYLPVGAELTITPAEGWRVSLDGEYDYMFWGRITNYASQISSMVNNFNNTITNGYGLRCSIKLVKEYDKFNLFIEPYFRFWDINKSDTVNVIAAGVPFATNQEASNKTTETGVRFGVEF